MAWTAPRTWAVGEEVSAAFLNTQIRDNLLQTMVALATTSDDLFQGTAANVLARIARSSTVGHVFKVLTATTIGWGAAPSTPVFGTGAIAFYNGAACPSGWAEVTAARGRLLVGLPAGGTLAGTAGPAALTNLGTVTITTVPAHTHGAGTLVFASAGAHTHTYPIGDGAGGNSAQLAGTTADDTGLTSSDGAHTHTVSGTSASTGSASVDVTMPYIQFIACRKS